MCFAMRGVRQSILALLAAIGLLFANAPSVAACPRSAAAVHPMMARTMMMMHHHRQPTPFDRDSPQCAACLAVLPSLTAAAPQPRLPFAAFASPFHPLSGIDPALDPPPPRAA
jgi:hypothetical protein